MRWLRWSICGGVKHGFVVRYWDLKSYDCYVFLFDDVKGCVNGEYWSDAASGRECLGSRLTSWEVVKDVSQAFVWRTRWVVCGDEVTELWWFVNACGCAEFGEKDGCVPRYGLWIAREEGRVVLVITDRVLRDYFGDAFGWC